MTLYAWTPRGKLITYDCDERGCQTWPSNVSNAEKLSAVTGYKSMDAAHADYMDFKLSKCRTTREFFER